MTIKDIFFGADGLPRSGWRFAIFVFMFIPAGAILSVAAALIAVGIAGGSEPRTSVFLAMNGIFTLTAALGVGWLCGKLLERLPFASLGATFERRWGLNLLLGIVLGIVTFAVGAGIGVASGGLNFSWNSATSAEIMQTLAVSFLVFAAAAAFEEALFRGYILQTFVRSNLMVFGVVLTSLLFATVHNGNPAASPISWINTLLAGVWFAVAYLKTRDLWLPFGLHLAWNWAQGSIFGVEVSGLTDLVKAPLLRELDVGPAWLTGGDYGIEGGVITTIAIVLSTVTIHFLPSALFGRPTADRNVRVPS